MVQLKGKLNLRGNMKTRIVLRLSKIDIIVVLIILIQVSYFIIFLESLHTLTP